MNDPPLAEWKEAISQPITNIEHHLLYEPIPTTYEGDSMTDTTRIFAIYIGDLTAPARAQLWKILQQDLKDMTQTRRNLRSQTRTTAPLIHARETKSGATYQLIDAAAITA